ncbi:MAG TPA: hypothetical protein ENI05_15215 [Porticoccus sp.]|nr:hypothetical protein [Porticoccus sp.]
MSGFGAGRPRPQPLMKIHSTLIAKDQVPVMVQVGDEVIVDQCYGSQSQSLPAVKGVMEFTPLELADAKEQADWVEVPLEKLAYARSGDKGNNANIGIIARQNQYLPLIYLQVTAQAIDDYFAHAVAGEVERFEVPGFNAFNFLLTEALGGGGTASLRLDSQGKAFGQMLLSMSVKVPPSWF